MPFQSFLSRLRQAVHAHDAETLATMMTKDFGYRLDPPGEGDGVFAYWDQNNIWPELELVLKERFIPSENYMVAPAEFALGTTSYTGYRAGHPVGERRVEIRLLRGRLSRPPGQGWRTASMA